MPPTNTLHVANSSTTSSSDAAMANAFVSMQERCSIILRILGNLSINDALCADIQRCCTITSSAS